MNSNLKSYISERYGNLEIKDWDLKYNSFLNDHEIETFEFPYGFFTAKQEGDALIVYDLYTIPKYRAFGYAWALFYDIKKLAQILKVNCIIGFSEHAGTKQELGRGAMTAAGFLEAFETAVAKIYFRGVN